MNKQQIINFTHQHAPCYIYDGENIINQARKIKQTLDGFDFLYSIKTNPFESIVKALAAQGIGADAASAAEVGIAAENGIVNNDIFYSAPGKSDTDIEETFQKCHLIADSIGEVMRINCIAKKYHVKSNIGIRVNPEFSMDEDFGVSSKFGIDETQLEDLAMHLKLLDNVRICGIHVHIKSQILDYEKLGRYYRNCFELAKKVSALLNCELEFINFGGGVGTIYDSTREHPMDFNKLKIITDSIAAENRASLHARLLIESGRYLVCAAGSYYTKIVDIKVSKGQKYLIIQNGLNGFMRPAITLLLQNVADDKKIAAQEPLYTSEHAFLFSVLNNEQEQECVDIVGNLCTATDTLAKNIMVNKASIGDVVSISNAGSYAYSLSPLLFSSHQMPKQYFIDAESDRRA
jgi:diaminopimelate decarboxylase